MKALLIPQQRRPGATTCAACRRGAQLHSGPVQKSSSRRKSLPRRGAGFYSSVLKTRKARPLNLQSYARLLACILVSDWQRTRQHPWCPARLFLSPLLSKDSESGTCRQPDFICSFAGWDTNLAAIGKHQSPHVALHRAGHRCRHQPVIDAITALFAQPAEVGRRGIQIFKVSRHNFAHVESCPNF